MKLRVQVRHDVGIALFAGQNDRRIAGQKLLQREDQEGHEHERRNDRGDSANQKDEHEI